MDHAELVRGRDAGEHVEDGRDQLVAARAAGERVAQGRAGEQLHDEERPAVRVDVDVLHAHDVGMVDGGRGARLGEDARRRGRDRRARGTA